MRARLRSESRIQVDHYIDTRLWLLSYSVYDDPLHNHLLLRRYDLLAMNLSQRFAELNVINDAESAILETQRYPLRFLFESCTSFGPRWTICNPRLNTIRDSSRLCRTSQRLLRGRKLARTLSIRCKPPICRCIHVGAIYRPYK